MTDEKFKFELSKPVTFGSEIITHLELSEPKTKELRLLKTKDLPLSDLIDIVGSCAGQPNKVMDKIAIKDTMKLVEWVNGFLVDSPETGGN